MITKMAKAENQLSINELELAVLHNKLDRVKDLIKMIPVTDSAIIYSALNNNVKMLQMLLEFSTYNYNLHVEGSLSEENYLWNIITILNINIKPPLNSLMQYSLNTLDTDLVEKLFNVGINIDDVLIGISNIEADTSGKIRYIIHHIMDHIDGVHFLTIRPEHIKNEKFLSNLDGFINPGALDSFPTDRPFTLKDLDHDTMFPLEYLYQDILSIVTKYDIPYLGICSGSQHLILHHGGTLGKVEGYTVNRESEYIAPHIAHFIPGTVSYFFTLSEEERFNMLDQCIFPEVSFPIYTSHNFSAVEHNLGGEVKVGAHSETGVIEAFSVGMNQIGIQFHLEYYYARDITAPNRQKFIIDNFLDIVKQRHDILHMFKNFSTIELTSRKKKQTYSYYSD
ncbi:hypothetical protein NOVO_07185 [Rickettsiales bacterium Ac37b]|nr:hypothetical protein NOVO_07185 [Rickettsiales bacterium Ac37b]